MRRRIHIKDNFQEKWQFNRRAIAALVLMVLLLLLVVGRLFDLQVLSHDHFATLSTNNRVKLVAVPPTRGLIYDRNGVLLADNVPSFSLEIIPEQVKNIEETLTRLKAIIRITDDDTRRFFQFLKRKRRFEGIPLRLRLTEKEVAIFSVNRYRFQGVDIQARLTRHYPLGSSGVHAIGYVGRIDENELQKLDESNYSGSTHIGKVGAEKSYEDTLHGTVGFEKVEINAQGRVLRTLEQTPPLPGKNIYLSIDSKLHAVAEQALGDQKGAIVAIAPDTGGVLALVSTPGYDPNLFVNGIDVKTYRQLSDSPAKPLFNRALLGRYPPGSTIKPFYGLAALDYGVVHTEHSLYCPGWYMLKNDDHKYRDWRKRGHGQVNLKRAITESCDVFFYDLAFNLGIDKLYAFMSRFGFGKKTNIDLNGEVAGLFPSREWKKITYNQPWYHGETLITGIGQGFTLITPLQLASATATLSMHGQQMVPRIIYATQKSGSDAITKIEPIRGDKIQLSSDRHWNTIINAMINVVHGKHGTARRIGFNARYKIAGKTGTAQVFSVKQDEEYKEEEVSKKLRDHSLFIAFAPAEKPRIAVAVVVENAGSGSAVAAPIARKVMDQYLLNLTK